MDSKEVVKITKECAEKYADSLGLEVDEESFDKMEQYLNSEVRTMLNETEQGIFDWGLDFLEMQKKSLEATIKSLSNRPWMNKVEEAHIELQIQLLDKFVDLLKKKTVLTPWYDDPKAQ